MNDYRLGLWPKNLDSDYKVSFKKGNKRSSLYPYPMMRVLVMIWGIIALLSLACIFYLDVTWLGNILLVFGVVISAITIKYLSAKPNKAVAAPTLSHGSVCVWQMDREA